MSHQDLPVACGEKTVVNPVEKRRDLFDWGYSCKEPLRIVVISIPTLTNVKKRALCRCSCRAPY